ncbi:4487_t:CDS:2 [Entrophospora sp. SA101]|nr:4487_t:CDS:2 [Entrophospora sp. SA101]
MASIELKFSGTFQKDDYLQEFSCVGCQQYLSEKDISKGNYRLYVSDYANEAVEHLECAEEGD